MGGGSNESISCDDIISKIVGYNGSNPTPFRPLVEDPRLDCPADGRFE